MHVLIGTDGSDECRRRRTPSDPLLRADVVALVCVVRPPAEASAGLESGFAGGVTPLEEIDAAWDAAKDARDALERTAAAIADAARSTSVELIVETGGVGP